MRTLILFWTLISVSLMAQTPPRQLLQIVREPIKEGNAAAFAAIEDETARACAELSCPHPHLALGPVKGTNEVWWFNLFVSENERQRVSDEYAKNGPLLTVLERNSKRKASLTETPVNLLLNYRADLSSDGPLELSGARFVTVTVVTDSVQLRGSFFDAPDETRLLLRPFGTREDAARWADRVGKPTTVLAVRPFWGMPAKEWLDADPEFWAPNPTSAR